MGEDNEAVEGMQAPVVSTGKRLTQKPSTAPALDKGLDILELLAMEERSLSRKEIAERLDRSVSEIVRMIDCLTRRSYLVQIDESFMLGMKLFELSHRFPPLGKLIAAALPRMRTLAKAINQSCHMTVLSGTSQLVVAQVDPPDGLGFSVRVGATLDAINSVSGRVLLAFKDQKEIEELLPLLDRPLEEGEVETLFSSLAHIRALGYSSMKSTQFDGVQPISFPILDLRGQSMAALTVPYLARLDDRGRPSQEGVQTALAAIAAELHQVLEGK